MTRMIAIPDNWIVSVDRVTEIRCRFGDGETHSMDDGCPRGGRCLCGPDEHVLVLSKITAQPDPGA